VIDRDQLAGRSLEVAPLLLGALLRSSIGGAEVTVRITEVEAYEGADDPASHAFRGPTPRNQVMFGEPGRLYCYFVYGMHWCANVTCGPAGVASAILLRAGEVIGGWDTARQRGAKSARPPDLARGPARLARSLGLTGADTGADLLDSDASVRLLELGSPASWATGPRVGINVAGDRPWRFWLLDEPSVSTYRPGVQRKR
jgi:DNA-3-methyladenine glycosylase